MKNLSQTLTIYFDFLQETICDCCRIFFSLPQKCNIVHCFSFSKSSLFLLTSICVKHTENIIFCAQNIFLMQHHLFLFFYCWHEILFRATSTRFCWKNITFCASQTVYFNTKLFSVQHQIFVLNIVHSLKCYVMVIYFDCHIVTKMKHMSKNK